MKFFDFGSLGFYRFFDFQKHLNFSIFRYSLINYYSYKEQSTLINDANLFKNKIVFLDKIRKDITNITYISSKENDNLSVNKTIFCDTLNNIKSLIKKYYPESEFLDFECDVLLDDEDTFDKFLDRLRYLNFKVDLKKKIEEFDRRNKTPYSCIKIATYFIKEEFLERLGHSIDFFVNEANNSSLDLINKEIDEYCEKVEQVKVSEYIKDTHKKFVMEYAKERISKIMKEHSLDISKLLVKISLLDIVIHCFESYYLNLLEVLNILLSISNIIEIGLDELPDAIFNEWNELIYLRRKEFQKLVLISDYVFQKRIISTINSGAWKFTFFSLSPRQGDVIQFTVDINKSLSSLEEGIKEYKLKIDKLNSLKRDWEQSLKNFEQLFV
ncbi:hypothetical protein ACE4V3_00995 [Borrelia recurrentis]|uniref:Uncharacterized conserved protein n=1 Tax=Borrelia recurrentis (strain A1) TaxID=412418 RepID=B5RPZ6_BORRA|nr:hypothetical protein [Borrelia recurrentis]ACH94880.1 uncharacterized conserved protein [Borrelia recurrentis A1]